jgi:argininosuccinate lyase
MKKPWAGRFTESTDSAVEAFTESISFDVRLWRHDIEGSIAHATMLGNTGKITKRDSKAIIKGLKGIASDIENSQFKFLPELEDVHMNIESALIAKIGPVGGKLHTARSRNDQVALDLRLYLRDEAHGMISMLRDFQHVLVYRADEHLDDVMPGYTHLQRAQPVLLSHYLLAYVEMFERDIDRLHDTLKRINVLPLGAGAMAGTSLPIDRKMVAKLLGFSSVSANSMDTVSDRDTALEISFICSVIMAHLSRLGEDIVLWSSEEFSFIELPDAYATGSSIMPQKKNPDVAELSRGKTGRVYGNLMALLTIVKGLPMAYNRDLQEDKPPVFDSIDTVFETLEVCTGMMAKIKFNTERMRQSASAGYSTATDVAEYLVRRGLPFRQAHEVTGKLVAYAIGQGKELDELTLKEFHAHSKLFKADVLKILSAEASAHSRSSEGGTSVKEVRKQLRKLKKRFSK